MSCAHTGYSFFIVFSATNLIVFCLLVYVCLLRLRCAFCKCKTNVLINMNFVVTEFCNIHVIEKLKNITDLTLQQNKT